jgi:hypothetical protein
MTVFETFVTSAAIENATSITGFPALIVAVSFLTVLILKDALGSGYSRWQMNLSRGLNIVIVPLGFAFFLVAVFTILQMMG